MDRDMSYELDGIFANRNAGELVKVTQTKTRMMRTPGLTSSGLNKPLGRVVPGPATRRLNPMMDRAIPATQSSRIPSDARAVRLLEADSTHAASDLADAYSPMDGLGVTVPGLGTISWAQLAVGATVGMVLGALFFRPKKR